MREPHVAEVGRQKVEKDSFHSRHTSMCPKRWRESSERDWGWAKKEPLNSPDRDYANSYVSNIGPVIYTPLDLSARTITAVDMYRDELKGTDSDYYRGSLEYGYFFVDQFFETCFNAFCVAFWLASWAPFRFLRTKNPSKFQQIFECIFDAFWPPFWAPFRFHFR